MLHDVNRSASMPRNSQDLSKASRRHDDGPCLSFENAKNMTFSPDERSRQWNYQSVYQAWGKRAQTVRFCMSAYLSRPLAP